MQYIALLSGLAGALVSAALGFWIRWYLDRAHQRRLEQNVAYVHLVNVSEIVATDALARAAIKVLIDEREIEKLKGDGSSYEPSHAVSALLYTELSKLTPATLAANKQTGFIARALRTFIEGTKGNDLTSDQLAKLPRQTILAYANFLTARTHARQCIEIWIEFLEHGGGKWFTADLIHHHWVFIDAFAQQAKVLRNALRLERGVSEFLCARRCVELAVG